MMTFGKHYSLPGEELTQRLHCAIVNRNSSEYSFSEFWSGSTAGCPSATSENSWPSMVGRRRARASGREFRGKVRDDLEPPIGQLRALANNLTMWLPTEDPSDRNRIRFRPRHRRRGRVRPGARRRGQAGDAARRLDRPRRSGAPPARERSAAAHGRDRRGAAPPARAHRRLGGDRTEGASRS